MSYEPPTVTPTGNMHDLLARAGCAGDHADVLLQEGLQDHPSQQPSADDEVLPEVPARRVEAEEPLKASVEPLASERGSFPKSLR
jgi:hypothetical protein